MCECSIIVFAESEEDQTASLENSADEPKFGTFGNGKQQRW